MPSAGSAINAYDVTGFPTHVVIDGEGRITARIFGAGKGMDDRIAALVERALTK